MSQGEVVTLIVALITIVGFAGGMVWKILAGDNAIRRELEEKLAAERSATTTQVAAVQGLLHLATRDLNDFKERVAREYVPHALAQQQSESNGRSLARIEEKLDRLNGRIDKIKDGT